MAGWLLEGWLWLGESSSGPRISFFPGSGDRGIVVDSLCLELTCSQDWECSAPSDKWLPSQHSVPCWHNTLLRQSDDHVIISAYHHNAASCLDVWQAGPRISVLKKEKQREKKSFANDLPEKISHRVAWFSKILETRVQGSEVGLANDERHELLECRKIFCICFVWEACVQIAQTPCTFLHNFFKKTAYHVALFVRG